MARELRCLYGDIIVMKDGVIAQSLGIPLGEYCVVLPKYVVCRGETPWRARWARLCRIIRGYGPRGLEMAVRASSVAEKYHPAFGTNMPAAHPWDALFVVEAVEALSSAVARGEPGTLGALSVLGLRGALEGLLGLTGSRAAGYSHERSDVDLVAYGPDVAVRLYETFSSLGGPWDPASKRDLGGVQVSKLLDLSWRRRVIETPLGRFPVTWTGAPSEPLAHCPPLQGLEGPGSPAGIVRDRVCIEPGQETALLYPPCAWTSKGWVVSFEYNLAGLLYNGGCITLEAVRTIDGIILLGVREFPGRIWVD
ncbi:MAG: hypothetical protein F7C34_02140 [Desulfurococcales archaeon]|nr:hypothetical protein [Desulfurococcales archaeon]